MTGTGNSIIIKDIAKAILCQKTWCRTELCSVHYQYNIFFTCLNLIVNLILKSGHIMMHYEAHYFLRGFTSIPLSMQLERIAVNLILHTECELLCTVEKTHSAARPALHIGIAYSAMAAY